jgi:hypothetical protein
MSLKDDKQKSIQMQLDFSSALSLLLDPSPGGYMIDEFPERPHATGDQCGQESVLPACH